MVVPRHGLVSRPAFDGLSLVSGLESLVSILVLCQDLKNSDLKNKWSLNGKMTSYPYWVFVKYEVSV